jgi:hypothetical protein
MRIDLTTIVGRTQRTAFTRGVASAADAADVLMMRNKK